MCGMNEPFHQQPRQDRKSDRAKKECSIMKRNIGRWHTYKDDSRRLPVSDIVFGLTLHLS